MIRGILTSFGIALFFGLMLLLGTPLGTSAGPDAPREVQIEASRQTASRAVLSVLGLAGLAVLGGRIPDEGEEEPA